MSGGIKPPIKQLNVPVTCNVPAHRKVAPMAAHAAASLAPTLMEKVERRTRARAVRSGAMLPPRTMLLLGSGRLRRVHLRGRRGGNGRQKRLHLAATAHLAAAAHDLLYGLGVCMGG